MGSAKWDEQRYEWFLERVGETHFEATPIVYECPWCDQVVTRRGELERHIAVEHPLPYPALYLGSQALGDRTLMTERIRRDEVGLANVDRVEVNGEPLTSSGELSDVLAMREHGACVVVLINEREDGAVNEKRYVLDFAIPKADELWSLDRQFLDLVHDGELRIDAIARFDGLPVSSTARSYRNALLDYLLGVRERERRSARAEHKYLAARSVLVAFRNRVLPAAITGTVDLACNHFAGGVSRSGLPSVDSAASFFRARAGRTHGDTSGQMRASSEADCGVYIDDALQGCIDSVAMVEAGLANEALEVVRHMLRHPPCSYDEIRLRVVGVAAAASIGATGVVANFASPLKFHPGFGTWAEGILKGADERR